jgi:hypothetical protein
MGGFEAAAIPVAMTVASQAIGSQQRQNSAEAAAQAQYQAADQRNQLVAAQQAQEEKRQRNLLAQQQAAVRARMGAWGTGGGGGSADALLQGMAQQTAESLAESAGLAALKRPARRQSLLDDGAGDALDMVGQGLNVFKSFYGGS